MKKLLVVVLFFMSMQSIVMAAQSLDGIAATVNSAVITQSELNQAISTAKKQMTAGNVTIPPSNVLHKQILDQLINKKLQLEAAEQAGIHVTAEQINRAISTIAEQNKISVKELYARVAEQGLSVSEYKKEIGEEIQIQEIEQQNVSSKISVTPEEVNDFLRSKSWQSATTKEYHLEDILITVPDSPTPQQIAAAKKHAEEILAQIHKGTSFSSFVTMDTPEVQGGDLGWRKLPEIPSAFADQLIHMQPKQVLGPIQTPNGFHLIHLDGIRSMNEHNNVADEKKQAQQLLYQRKFEEELQKWLTQLRSSATIKTS